MTKIENGDWFWADAGLENVVGPYRSKREAKIDALASIGDCLSSKAKRHDGYVIFQAKGVETRRNRRWEPEAASFPIDQMSSVLSPAGRAALRAAGG